jgi:hypothetical protein
MQESMDIMKNASEKLSVVKGEAVLKRHSGFSTFTSICQVLNGDVTVHCNFWTISY